MHCAVRPVFRLLAPFFRFSRLSRERPPRLRYFSECLGMCGDLGCQAVTFVCIFEVLLGVPRCWPTLSCADHRRCAEITPKKNMVCTGDLLFFPVLQSKA